jgi:hypothetical protein
VNPVQYSRPSLAAGTTAPIETDSTGHQFILSLPGLRISATPRNSRTSLLLAGPAIPPLPIIPMPGWEGLDYSPPFIFDVQLYPEAGAFSIDPMRVALWIADQGSHAPVGFVGPFEAQVYWGHKQTPKFLRGKRFICGVWEGQLHAELDDLRVRRTEGPIDLPGASCLGLLFDLPAPPPSRKFELQIDGIERNGAPVEVPVIYFEQARGWERDTVP